MRQGTDDLKASENAWRAWAEAWAERAAILEYDAGMSRKEAEKEAQRMHQKP